jgi:chitodextrinase
MKNIYQKPIVLSLALMLTLSPALSYAKEKEGREERGNKIQVGLKAEAMVEKKDSKIVRVSPFSCAKAFGHLISSGYQNKNGESDLNFWKDCVIPFGIAKKLGVGTSTPPVVDATSPVISDISVETKTHEAVISWKTDERSDSKVYWSLTSPVTATSSVKTNATLTTDHKITLKNLTATTTYHFLVSSRDKTGNTSTSSPMTFTTKAESDVTVPVISNIQISVGTSTAALSWNTNENADSRVYWSTVNPLVVGATTTASTTSSLMTQAHQVPISGLSATTTYYFKVESRDASGNSSSSTTFSATTN